MNIREQIEKIINSYDPECDRHPDGVQVNVTDMRILDMIEALEARLARLEVFTGMVLPDPLPATNPAGDAPTEARATDEEIAYPYRRLELGEMIETGDEFLHKKGWILADDFVGQAIEESHRLHRRFVNESTATTFAGSVDYGDSPAVPQLDTDGAMLF